MNKLLCTAALCAAFSATDLAAQACSTLATAGTGKAGTTLTITLSGADKNAFALLALGQTAGSTTFDFGPLGSVTFGLAQPFGLFPLGQTDATGKATLAIQIPTSATTAVNLKGQGTTAVLTIQQGPPSLDFCTSNVVAFTVGGV